MLNILPGHVATFRLPWLAQTTDALRQTGVSFLERTPGGAYVALNIGDSLGIYWIVPRIALALNVTPATAYGIFLTSLLVCCLAAGLLGIFLVSRTGLGRLYGCAAISLVTLYAAVFGDVYILPAMVPIALVPWVLLLLRRRSLTFASFAALGLVGLACGLANEVRGVSGDAVLVFTAILIWFSVQAPSWRRLVGILALLLGVLVVTSAMGLELSGRNAFVAKVNPSAARVVDSHVLWHSIYIGFGYFKNPYVAGYSDEVGVARAQQLKPGVLPGSTEYEAALRGAVIELVVRHPLFVARTLLKKSGEVLAYFLLFANVGLWCAVRYRKPRPLDAAFLIAACVAALYGLVAVPLETYLLGVFAFAALFAWASVDHARECALSATCRAATVTDQAG